MITGIESVREMIRNGAHPDTIKELIEEARKRDYITPQTWKYAMYLVMDYETGCYFEE